MASPRNVMVIEIQYEILISIYSENLKHNAGFVFLYLGNYSR